MKILIISSESLTQRSSRLAFDQFQALKQGGHEVDLLTKYKEKDFPDFLYVYEQKKNASFSQEIFRKLRVTVGKFLKKAGKQYYFFYKKEVNPPVPTTDVLNKIDAKYDLIIITFWQELLSFETVDGIYKKCLCPIFINAVDMSPFTGGCHYFWDCRRFEIGCGKCPAYASNDPNDFTHYNALYRKEVYKRINYVFMGTTWMNNFAIRSFVMDGGRVEKSCAVINDLEFRPRNKDVLREQFKINSQKEFIIFAGASSLSDPRKGMKFMFEALQMVYNELSPEIRTRILVLLAGSYSDTLKDSIPFDMKYLGYVGFDELSRAFSLSDLYLSPSIEDAGPMMVNQALSSGVPVVSFNIGVAIDVIKGKETGYCAMVGDSKDFANGILHIIGKSKEEYQLMAIRCREVADQTSSYQAYRMKIMELYKKYHC